MKDQKINKTLLNVKGSGAQQAIAIGKDYGFNLNYSVESLPNVATILNDTHKEYVATSSEEGLNGLAMMFGMYLIKVIEQNVGEGELAADDPEMGEMTFPFVINGQTYYPYVWCLKNIYNGEEDSVYLKYRFYFLNEKKGSFNIKRADGGKTDEITLEKIRKTAK